jgi:prepilin-type N-terminal cleavage/methylation domain-containing protein
LTRHGFTLPRAQSEVRGRSNNDRDRYGFTLIEIMVVLLLIGLIFSFVLPQFRARTDADLKRSSIRLAATIQNIFYQSAFRRETYRLQYDLANGRYRLDRFVDPSAPGPKTAAPAGDTGEAPDAEQQREEDLAGLEGKPHYVPDRSVLPEPVRLPEGVRITDVTTQYLDTISEGNAFTHFFPDGYAEPTVIHLADRNKREYTLVVSPLSGKVQVIPRREEFEIDMKEERP